MSSLVVLAGGGYSSTTKCPVWLYLLEEDTAAPPSVQSGCTCRRWIQQHHLVSSLVVLVGGGYSSTTKCPVWLYLLEEDTAAPPSVQSGCTCRRRIQQHHQVSILVVLAGGGYNSTTKCPVWLYLLPQAKHYQYGTASPLSHKQTPHSLREHWPPGMAEPTCNALPYLHLSR